MFSLILSTYPRPDRKVSSGGLHTSTTDLAWACACASACACAEGTGLGVGPLACASLIEPAYLITCCVIVDAPCTMWPAAAFARKARIVALRSTPLFDQKVRSSVATVASTTHLGTFLKATDSRFWHSKRARSAVLTPMS